ncbi:MAG: hypothetical protein L0177_06030, partial [Chloroflexi bacterium]|nr:hypothetical protein [Chloroflexota bacterium]
MNEDFINRDSEGHAEEGQQTPAPATNGAYIDRASVDAQQTPPSEPIGQGGLRAQAFGRSIALRHAAGGGRNAPSDARGGLTKLRGIGLSWVKGVSKFRASTRRSMGYVLRRAVYTPARWTWNQAYDSLTSVVPTWRKRRRVERAIEPEVVSIPSLPLRRPRVTDRPEAPSRLDHANAQRKSERPERLSAPLARKRRQPARQQRRPIGRVPATFIKKREITRAVPRVEKGIEKRPIEPHVERRITSEAVEPVADSAKWAAHEYESAREEQPKSVSDLFSFQERKPRQRELKPLRSERASISRASQPAISRPPSPVLPPETPQPSVGDASPREQSQSDSPEKSQPQKGGLIQKSRQVFSKGKSLVFRKALPEASVSAPDDRQPQAEIVAERQERLSRAAKPSPRSESGQTASVQPVQREPAVRKPRDSAAGRDVDSFTNEPANSFANQPAIADEPEQAVNLRPATGHDEAEPPPQPLRRESGLVLRKSPEQSTPLARPQHPREPAPRSTVESIGRADEPPIGDAPVRSPKTVQRAKRIVSRARKLVSRKQSKPAPPDIKGAPRSQARRSSEAPAPEATPSPRRAEIASGAFSDSAGHSTPESEFAPALDYIEESSPLPDIQNEQPAERRLNPVSSEPAAEAAVQREFSEESSSPRRGLLRRARDLVFRKPAPASQPQPASAPSPSSPEPTARPQRVPAPRSDVTSHEAAPSEKPTPARVDAPRKLRPISRAIQRSRRVFTRTRDFVFRKPAARVSKAISEAPSAASERQNRQTGASKAQTQREHRPAAIQRSPQDSPSRRELSHQIRDDSGEGEKPAPRLAAPKPMGAMLDTALTLSLHSASPASQTVSETVKASLEAPARRPAKASSEPVRAVRLTRSPKSAPRKSKLSRHEGGGTEAEAPRLPSLGSAAPSKEQRPTVQSHGLPLASSQTQAVEARPPLVENSSAFERPLSSRKLRQEGIAGRLSPEAPPASSAPRNGAPSSMVFRKAAPMELEPQHAHSEIALGPSRNGKNGHSSHDSGASKSRNGKTIQRDAAPATPESLNAAYQAAKSASG